MSEEGTATRWADDAHRYQLDSRIATGGMGEVWRATDTTLGRTVAVKLLKAEYADDARFRSRFSSEAQHAAALHHSGVASVFDFGEATAADGSDSPRPYLVMEYVEGEPLSSLLKAGQPLDPEVARDLLAQAADAIGAAHRAGIVHRDVKPANLIVTPDRRVKITDFGIARAAEGLALTETGQVMGTPQYLSPEQARGGTATPASDVYSLGVVGFEALAGRRPFVAETAVATALAHLREPVPDLPDTVPADLAGVIRRSLAKEPSDRYADGTALAAALRDRGTVPPPPATTQVLPAAPPAEPVPPPGDPRRVPWLWLLLGLVALIAVIALIAFAVAAGDDPTTEPRHHRTATPSSSTASQPTSSAPSSPTSSAAQTVEVDKADYVGRPEHDVTEELKSLGLEPHVEKVDNDGTHEEGTVADLDPSGTMNVGDPITVYVYDKPLKVKPPKGPKPGKGPKR